MTKRILIVDDEENVLITLEDGLGSISDVTITTAPGGAEAYAKLVTTPFDLIITDYKMPRMSGLQLIEFARQLYPTVTAIILTAYRTEELERRAEAYRVYKIFDKPAPLKEIRATINQLLHGSDSQ
ncbi:MAG TPA: response regulator [Anaerolineae bacterium]|nr:response regulator [Anaerolineae bacterium]